MKLKLQEIVFSESIWSRIFASHPDAKTAFRLAMMRRQLQPILEEHGEAKRGLLESHATETEDRPGFYHFRVDEDPESEVDQKRFDAFNEEYNDLLQAEVEVDFGIPIALVDKCAIEPTLSPDEILAIAWLIREGQKEIAKGMAAGDGVVPPTEEEFQ